MKAILLILIIFGCAGVYLFNKKTGLQMIITEKTDAPSPGLIDFKTQIEPILKKNCSPCHFPGGKQYGKLPFDNGKTILGLEGGVLKRIKDEKEKILISSYIEQNMLGRK